MALGQYKEPVVPAVWEPDSLEELWNLKAKLGQDGMLVAGGTLLRTQWEAGMVQMPPHLISLASIPELCDLRAKDGVLSIGAAVTLHECHQHPAAQQGFKLLSDTITLIAAPSVRRIGTLGGNVMSAVGDAIPTLLTGEAELDFYDGNGEVSQTLDEWLREGHAPLKERPILLRLRIKEDKHSVEPTAKPAADRTVRYVEKIGQREAFTPSLVTAAFHGRLDGSGRLERFCIAAGGGSGRAMRLTQTESLLNGMQLSEGLLSQVYEAAYEEFITYTDWFASEAYRKTSAANAITAGLWKLLREMD